MERPHIITLSGKPGSGKSSTADKVAELLGYTRYSSGDFVRKVIKKKGLTLEEYNEQAVKDHQFDHLVDEELRKLREEKNVVIDSRLGFYWIPESFKVYLDLDIEVSIARIYNDFSLNLRHGETSVEESMQAVAKSVKARLRNEQSRFMKLYGVDPYKNQNFDLVIDTSRHSPQTVALAVFDNYKKWLKTEEWEPVAEKVPIGYSFKNQY
jgi:cytidylate kinase